MNYTPNYHLPTWAMTDRIQMSDFNDMTAKLDAALASEAAARESGDRMTVLADKVNPSPQQQFSVSLSGIDLTAYRQIDVYFQAKMADYTLVSFYLNSTTAAKQYYPCGDGSSSGGYYNTNNKSEMASFRCDKGQTLTAHLDLGMPCAGNHILCQCYQAAVGSSYADVAVSRRLSTTITWSTLRTLIFKSASTSDLIPAGARVTVVGLKV